MKTRDQLLKMPVRDFMEMPVKVEADTPITDLKSKFASSNANAVIYDDADGKFAGLITKSDFLKLAEQPGLKTAKDIATKKDVVGVHETAVVWQLIGTMNGTNARSQRVNVIPVVDTQKKVIGIVSREHLKSKLDEAASE